MNTSPNHSSNVGTTKQIGDFKVYMKPKQPLVLQKPVDQKSDLGSSIKYPTQVQTDTLTREKDLKRAYKEKVEKFQTTKVQKIA